MKRSGVAWALALVLVAFFLSVSLPLSAQLAIDPNDRMYTDLKLWEDRGILQNLPQLKPYPIQLLKKLLSDVQEKGNASDGVRAREYAAGIDGLINIHVGVGTELRTDLKGGSAQFTFGGPFQGSLDPLVTYSGYLAGVASNASENAFLPEYSRSTVDSLYDAAVTPIGGTSFIPRVSSATAAALGSDTFYFQAGNIRGSWGPFWGENVVLSPSTIETGQFSYVYRGEHFTASEAVLALSAVGSDGTGGPLPGKYLALHGLEVYLLPWLTLGIFESMVWGPRFEMLYMLPFATYFYTGGLVGYPDNSFIGINGGIKLPSGVRIDAVAYFDDMSFNDIIKFHFDTKLKFAFQTGVSWTPEDPLLARLSLNVLMVTPYTYSHTNNNGDTPSNAANYLDYTTAGMNIGPSLQPNSLRVEVSALLRPDPVVDVQPFGRMILHGNASTTADNPAYTGTGTIFDNGDAQNAYNKFHFLDQSVIEKTFQIGVSSKAWFGTPIGKVNVFLNYAFEYILDAGLSAGATALNNYLGIGCGYQY